MNIGGLEKISLIDYPGKVSAVIFTQGCNFRCDYCHNPELVYPSLFQESIPEREVFAFLRKRTGKLQAVVITGGEPTMQENLLQFIGKIRRLGFLVKLDTNGSNPELVRSAIEKKLVQYLAMDIKGPLKKYQKIACAAVDPEKVVESIGLIMRSGVDYEFRTTVIKSQLGGNDFVQIGQLIKGASLYALQKFRVPPMLKINNRGFLREKTYTDEEFRKIKTVMEKYVRKCVVR